MGRQRGSRVFECDANLTLASVLLRSDGLAARAAIESAIAEAARLAHETGARSRVPFVHLRRAEFAALAGDSARHDDELRAAVRVFTDNGAAAYAARLTHELTTQTAAVVSS